MRTADLSGINPNNRGAVALRNFIEYAERDCMLPVEAAVLTEEETNDFEDAVAEALRGRGYAVDQQVGASGYRIDLAVRDPGDPARYLLGIECDGATYHSAKTARDRDLLREHVLKDLGWRLHRIWSTEWFRDRERAIDTAVGAVEKARHAPADHSVFAPPVRVPEEDPERRPAPVQTVARRYPSGTACQKYTGSGERQLLLEAGRRRDLAVQVVRIVTVEGPIHQNLLTERLEEVNGVGRVGDRVAANIQHAVQIALGRQELERLGTDFLRRPGRTLSTFRTSGDGVQRPAAWIPIDEIQLAVLHIVEDQFGCQRGALPRAVGELFGFDRTPGGLAELVATAVDILIDETRLQTSGPNVYVP